MDIIFRTFQPDEPRIAPPGELHVRPAHAKDDVLPQLACLAADKGVAAFVRGTGETKCVVLKRVPTFDDMLAMLLLLEDLADRRLAGARPFGLYAAALRRGVRPNPAIAIEDSPEGIFAAVRNSVGNEPLEGDRAARFLAGWERIAAVLRPALEQGVDPQQTAVFAGLPEFVVERSYLKADETVYRRDRARGQRWRLTVPGQAESVPALWLHNPHSAMFAWWSRSDPDAPGGRGYSFLAVSWGGGQWTFSTDPANPIRIDSLAAELQAAEKAKDRERAAADPWYDGSRNEYTLVGAPHSGTRLADDEVLTVVRRWGNVTRIRNHGLLKRRLALTAGLAAVALVAGLGTRAIHSNEKVEGAAVAPAPDLPIGALIKRFDENTAQALADDADLKEDRALIPIDEPIAEVNEPNHTIKTKVKLRGLGGDRKTPIRFTLCDADPVKEWPQEQRQVEVTVPGHAPRSLAVEPNKDGESKLLSMESDPEFMDIPAGVQEVGVTFHNCTKEQLKRLRFCWRENRLGTIHLHVLAVGVAKYRNSDLSLNYADADAIDVVRAFKKQKGPLFGEVDCFEPVVNDKATRSGILNALRDFATKVNVDPAPLKLAFVHISGHGSVSEGKSFVFLPHDYDPKDDLGTHVIWQDLTDSLRTLNCPVILSLDTCHSGQAAVNESQVNAKGGAEIERALQELKEQGKGIYVLAACKQGESAFEDKKLGHGLLTFSLLEALDGKARHGSERVIRLEDVSSYINRRMQQLARNMTNEGKSDKQTFKDWGPYSILPRHLAVGWDSQPRG